jgi:subtilase family serine protease
VGNVIEIVLGPDLEAAAISGPRRAGTATSVSVTNMVRNIGSGNPGPFRASLYLSSDSFITTNDLRLASRTVLGLVPGGTNLDVTTVTIPAGLAPGSYWFGLIADDLGQVPEISEANNVVAGQLVEVVPGPDLVVTKLRVPLVAVSGGSLALTSIVHNIGLADIDSTVSFRVGYYFSTDSHITTNDLFLGLRTINGLAAGGSVVALSTFTVSLGVEPGFYHLGAIVDYQNVVAEVHEDNNTLEMGLIQISAGPDFEVTQITGPATAGSGASVPFTTTVRNIGTGRSDLVSLGIYLSTDATITTNDLRVGGRQVSLGPGETSTEVTMVPLSPALPLGTYYLGAIADDANLDIEPNESNNALTGGQIQIVQGADLVMTSVQGPVRAGTGTAMFVTNTVQNAGAIDVTSTFRVGFYLSTNAAISSSNTFLGQRFVLGGLQAGQSNTEVTGFFLSEGLGQRTYFLSAIADYDTQISESIETNNALAAGLIEVSYGPDLVMTACSGPATAVSGGSLMVSDTAANIGAGILSRFSVGFYLSSDPVITTNDLRIGGRVVTGTLAPGASSSGTTLLSIPAALPAGTYFLGAVADDLAARGEANEANNAILAGPITIPFSEVDLELSALAGPAQASTNASFFVTNTVRNIGKDGAASFTVSLYLTHGPVIATNDFVVASRTVPALAAGESSTEATLVTLGPQVNAGHYFLAALADSAVVVPETTKTNNTLVGAAIDIDVDMDLVMTSVRGPIAAGTGSAIFVTNTVQNAGATDVTLAFRVGFYLSSNATISLSNTFLGQRFVVGGLRAGQSNTEVTAFFLSEKLGQQVYFLSAIADYDANITESVETNNALAAGPVEVSYGPDLIMTACSGPATAVTGGTLLVTNTVANVGIGLLSQFSVGFYLSADPVIGTNDYRLGERTLNILVAGTASSATTILSIPPGLPAGTYYLGAIADDRAVRGESNEFNNGIVTGPITIAIGPDLQVASVIAPAVAGTGLFIQITNSIQNAGTGNPGPFNFAVYLSPVTTLTTNAILLARRPLPGLDAGTTLTTNTLVALSSQLVPGPYYILVVVDDTDDVMESNENNNAASTPILILKGPDLVVTSVTNPDQAAIGATILVTNRVENTGFLPVTAPIRVGLYLSSNDQITTNDLRIGSRLIPAGLAVGEGSTDVTPVTLPFLSTGPYRLGAIVDDIETVPESDESNNSRTGNLLDIIAVRLGNIQLQGNDIVLSFATVPGKNYRLERTDNLNPPVLWTPVNNVAGTAGTNGILSITDFGALAQPMRFYQVRLLE